MATFTADPDVVGVDDVMPEPMPSACPCGHLEADHDAIASRFCAATTGGALERGCICRPKPARTP